MGELRWDGHSRRSGRFGCESRSRICQILREPPAAAAAQQASELATRPPWARPAARAFSNSLTPGLRVELCIGADGRGGGGGTAGQQCRARRVE
jgi:hypothetical protein